MKRILPWLALALTAGAAYHIGTLNAPSPRLAPEAGHRASTTCSSEATVTVVAAALKSVAGELAYLHEGVHVAQIRRLGCQAFDSLQATPEGRLSLEAPAYCQEARLLIARGQPRDMAVESTTHVLFQHELDIAALGRPAIAAEALGYSEATCELAATSSGTSA